MENTITPGRIDIIIFPNGGKEIIGRINSEPKINEFYYLNEIKFFVENNKPEKEPIKYTCYYKFVNNKLQTSWTTYAGEIINQEETTEEQNNEKTEI